MERKVSLNGILLGLVIFIAGAIFLIVYSSELLLEKVTETDASFGSGVYSDRLYRILDLYLDIKHYVIELKEDY